MIQLTKKRRTASLLAYARLFGEKPALSGFVFLLTTLGMLMDGLGLLMLVPVLGAFTGDSAHTAITQKLISFLGYFGLQPTLGVILGGFVALMAARSILRLANEWASTLLRSTITDSLRTDALSALMSAEWRWLNERKRSDQTNMLLTEVQRIASGVHGALALQATAAAIAAYLIAAFLIEPIVTGLVALTGALLFLLLSGQQRKALNLGIEQGAVNRALHENALESVGAIKMTKILGTQAEHVRSFSYAVRNLRANQLRFAIQSTLSRETFQFVGVCMVAAYIYLGVTVWNVPIAQLLVLVFIFARIAPMLTSAQQWIYRLLNALPPLIEAQDVIRQAREAAEPSTTGVTETFQIKSKLELQDVTVRFSDVDRAALDRVSLSIPVGALTLVTGPSGAGKSTLADVLMGLLAPNTGKLLLDEKPLDGAERMIWRKSISYVPQEVTLYDGAIRENLLRADNDATDQQIANALQAASAEFVFTLPDGLDTRIGDGAHGLSGGEMQRIALARGLLRKPALLVLDEVTSALDEANENRIRDRLAALAGSVTIVVLTHSKSFHQIADQVIELDGGRISSVWKKG